MPDKLPEEFAPTGPKLSKFPIRPAPPIRPHLYPDEARFALRLAVLVGGTEFAAWICLATSHSRAMVLALAGLRLLGPVWARLGTRVPRTAIALALLFVAIVSIAVFPGSGLVVVAAGLPAIVDLSSSCVGDSVTVERRSAAYSWLDMGRSLGALLAVCSVPILHRSAWTAAVTFNAPTLGALLLAATGVAALRDRGTPRSAWPFGAYLAVLRSPISWQIVFAAFLVGALGPGFSGPSWLAGLLLVAMAVAARIDRWMPNAIWLPRIAALLAALGHLHQGDVYPLVPLPLFALGIMFAAIPASVARGAGEMERPLVSSLAWSALFVGAAVRSAC